MTRSATTDERSRMNRREVAKRYGCSTDDLLQMAEAGEVPVHRWQTIMRNGKPHPQPVFLRESIEAHLRRLGELTAERAVNA